MKYDPNAGAPFRRPYRFFMAFLILIVPFCTMVPYVAPAVFMGDIMAQFGVDMSLAGLSMTIQLGATGICMFIGSVIQDKLGIRKSVILSIWSMVLGNLVAALAPNIGLFLFARFISGFGQGLYTVSMTPCISTWFANKERTYMITFNTAANSVFLAISYSIGRHGRLSSVSMPALLRLLRFYGRSLLATVPKLWRQRSSVRRWQAVEKKKAPCFVQQRRFSTGSF